jgi:Ca2+-binding RTX toxin-like protein
MPVVTTNRIGTSAPGVEVTANDQIWIIAPGVLVTSNESAAVDGLAFDRMTLANFGRVLSSSEAAAFSAGNHVDVFNEASGLISGSTGVLTLGDDVFVRNRGQIIGFDTGVLFGSDALPDGPLLLVNSGQISGSQSGVAIDSASSDGRILNRGLIESERAAIRVKMANEILTTVLNEGRIRSDDDAIETAADGGGLVLRNSGKVIGDIDCNGAGQVDAVTNNGSIDGLVALGPGSDFYDGRRGGKADLVVGEDGNDRLEGGNKVDFLKGQAGNDGIDGGLANDILSGGSGKDVFAFQSVPNSKTNRDAILDFSPGEDTIGLRSEIYKGLNKGVLAAKYFHVGQVPLNANDRIIYDPKSGNLMWAQKGNQGAVITFADLDPGLGVTSKDFLVV